MSTDVRDEAVREEAGRDDAIDRVVSQTMAFVKRRGYTAGERLPSERDLASRFSVSRSAVREAMTKLQAMRVIERRPGSGIFLGKEPGATSLEALVLSHDLGIPLDDADIHESMEVRRILEVQAIGLACERRTEADLAALHGLLAATEAEVDAERSISEMDYQFHMAIFRATQNMILVRVVNPFYLFSRTRRETFFQDRARGRVSHAQHVEIVAAIAAADAARGAELMATHIGRVERYYLDRSAVGST